MELLQLKYFCAAAKFQNFSRAAEQFIVPQSSISKTVANLEKELGCKLFTRSGKHVYLNDCGKAFLKRVELALSSLENAIPELEELTGKKQKNIRLAVWESSKLLPQILSEFQKENRKACFSLLQHAEVSVLTFEFDLCICSLPISDDKLDYLPLISEEILLAVPVQHPLARYSYVSLSDLQNESFISLASSKSFRRITDSYCNIYGYHPRVIFECDDAATVRGLIENGLGVAFVPMKTWKTSHTDLIKLLHIKDLDCRRTIAICWYKNSYLSPVVQEFRQFVIEWYKKL